MTVSDKDVEPTIIIEIIGGFLILLGARRSLAVLDGGGPHCGG